MVRTLKWKASPGLKKGESAVLLPGATSAEPWEVWALSPDTAACAQICQRPGDNPRRRVSTLVLPACFVHALPLWFNQAEAKLIREAVPLQLELRGLQSRQQPPAIFDISIVAQEEERTLALVCVLPSSLPAELDVETYQAFDVSPRFYPLPEDAVTLWPERDRLVCAITRGPNLIYFCPLGDGSVTPRLIQNLRCAVQGLHMQRVPLSPQRIVLWTDRSPEEMETLQQALSLPVERSERPPPRRPEAPSTLVPTPVAQARQTRQRRKWKIRGAILAAVIYLVLVGCVLARLYVSSGRVNELAQWKAEQAPSLAVVHETRAAWDDLRPVVDEQDYPLELLSHVADSIPGDRLHLTLFESGDGHLLLKGEAKDVSTAFSFLDGLKKDSGLSNYAWEMGQPHLLPNDLAQLQIEATRGAGDF